MKEGKKDRKKRWMSNRQTDRQTATYRKCSVWPSGSKWTGFHQKGPRRLQGFHSWTSRTAEQQAAASHQHNFAATGREKLVVVSHHLTSSDLSRDWMEDGGQVNIFFFFFKKGRPQRKKKWVAPFGVSVVSQNQECQSSWSPPAMVSGRTSAFTFR